MLGSKIAASEYPLVEHDVTVVHFPAKEELIKSEAPISSPIRSSS